MQELNRLHVELDKKKSRKAFKVSLILQTFHSKLLALTSCAPRLLVRFTSLTVADLRFLFLRGQSHFLWLKHGTWAGPAAGAWAGTKLVVLLKGFILRAVKCIENGPQGSVLPGTSRYFTSFYLSLPFLNWQRPSLPSFRPIFPLPTPYSGRGRPFRSVSALSFVPPSPISHPCTLSSLILAGAGHWGPSLQIFILLGISHLFIFHFHFSIGSVHLCPLFAPFFPSPPLILAGAGHLGPSLPFRSSHLLPFSAPASPPHPLFWQGPAI